MNNGLTTIVFIGSLSLLIYNNKFYDWILFWTVWCIGFCYDCYDRKVSIIELTYNILYELGTLIFITILYGILYFGIYKLYIYLGIHKSPVIYFLVLYYLISRTIDAILLGILVFILDFIVSCIVLCIYGSVGINGWIKIIEKYFEINY